VVDRRLPEHLRSTSAFPTVSLILAIRINWNATSVLTRNPLPELSKMSLTLAPNWYAPTIPIWTEHRLRFKAAWMCSRHPPDRPEGVDAAVLGSMFVRHMTKLRG